MHAFVLGAQLEHLAFEFLEYGIVWLINSRLALQYGNFLLLQFLLLECFNRIVAVQAQQRTPRLYVWVQYLCVCVGERMMSNTLSR